MSKRFTDTEKWNKRFFRSLPSAYKLFFWFLLDECSSGGIWDVDMEVARVKTGENLDEAEALKLFAKHVHVVDNGNKWFLPDFIEFQYGTLNANNRAHQKAIFQLKKLDLIDDSCFVKKGLTSPLQGAMVEVEVKVEDKVEDKVKEGETFKVDVIPLNSGNPVAQVSMISLLSVEACMAEYFNNNSYARTREQICISHYLKPDELRKWAVAYNEDMIMRGDLSKTLADWMRHFKFWLAGKDVRIDPKYQNTSNPANMVKFQGPSGAGTMNLEDWTKNHEGNPDSSLRRIG